MDSLFAQQLLEKTRRDYDAIALSFSETRERVYDLQLLVSDVKSGERVLDVGCGNGRLLDALPVGVEYTGGDTSEQMIAIAKSRHIIPLPTIRFLRCDILSLPFAPASFDHVFALAVLHHIPSSVLRQQAVAQLVQVVKPGGRITITVWDLRHWYWLRRYHLWRLLFGLHPKEYDRGDCLIPWRRGVAHPLMRYVHTFTRKELQALLRDAGCDILAETHTRNYMIVARRPVAEKMHSMYGKRRKIYAQ